MTLRGAPADAIVQLNPIAKTAVSALEKLYGVCAMFLDDVLSNKQISFAKSKKSAGTQRSSLSLVSSSSYLSTMRSRNFRNGNCRGMLLLQCLRFFGMSQTIFKIA